MATKSNSAEAKEAKAKEARILKARQKNSEEAAARIKEEEAAALEAKEAGEKKILADLKKRQAARKNSVTAVKTRSDEKGTYDITVEMNDKVFTKKKVSNIVEMLKDLNPEVFKTKVVIKASYGAGKNKKSSEFVLMIPKAKQVFRNELASIFFEKNLKRALNGK